jgi:hypothetical protein
VAAHAISPEAPCGHPGLRSLDAGCVGIPHPLRHPAALTGQPEIAVGNVVGSNSFNLMGVLGLSGLVTTAAWVLGPLAVVAYGATRARQLRRQAA